MNVLFLHGTAATKSVWEKQITFLEERNIRGEAIDLPAHGDDKNKHFSIDEAYKKIDAAIAKNKDEETVLVGSSLGGYLAIGYASEHEEIKGVFASGCATDNSHSTTPKILSRIAKALASLFKRRAFNSISDMLEEIKGFSSVEKLEILVRGKRPVRMISGEWCFLRKGEKEVKTLLKDNYRVIPKAAHNINSRKPDAFNEQLHSFLKDFSTKHLEAA